MAGGFADTARTTSFALQDRKIASESVLLLPGIKRADHSFIRDEPVTALEQRRNQLPIDLDVHPYARPKAATVRSLKEVLSPDREIHIGWRESQRNRWATAHHLKGAECLLPGAEIRVTPGRCFSGLWKGQTQSPRACEYRAIKFTRHNKSAVKMLRYRFLLTS